VITRLNTVSLYVTDQERAKDFYVAKLGFELTTDQDMGGMGRWVEVRPQGSSTGFVLADAAKFDKTDRVGSSADITLRSDDVRQLHADLVAKGVTVTDVDEQSWGTFVTVTDPDGHQLVIGQE